MFYEDLGKPDSLPIIMLHGFTGTGRADWIHQIDVFGSGFRLILPICVVMVGVAIRGAVRR